MKHYGYKEHCNIIIISCASHTREVVHVLVLSRRAHGMSDKQFVYANRAVFST